MKYMLISVCEREIETAKFDTYEDARNAMMHELYEEYYRDYYSHVASNVEEIEATWSTIVCHDVYDSIDDWGNTKFAFGEMWAWSNIDPDWNYDWKIVEI